MLTMILDDMNRTTFTASKCGHYMFVQHLNRGELCEERPLTLEHARKVWHRLFVDGYKRHI